MHDPQPPQGDPLGACRGLASAIVGLLIVALIAGAILLIVRIGGR